MSKLKFLSPFSPLPPTVFRFFMWLCSSSCWTVEVRKSKFKFSFQFSSISPFLFEILWWKLGEVSKKNFRKVISHKAEENRIKIVKKKNMKKSKIILVIFFAILPVNEKICKVRIKDQHVTIHILKPRKKHTKNNKQKMSFSLAL